MRKSRVTALIAALALGLATVLGVGCGGDDDGETTGGGGVVLTVGSDIPYPPFEQGKAPDYEGFDVELMEAVAEAIGREARFEDTSFDTIFLDLAQGNFDVVASASTITAEREQTVDFTDPYYLSEQAILVKEGSEIDSVQRLAGAKVGVQQGTTGEEFVEEQAEAREVRKYPQGPDAVNAVKTGSVDAVVIDIPVAENAVEAQDGLELSAAIPTEEEYGFAVAQGNDELLEVLNEGLRTVKEDGTYARIFEKWFGREPPQAILTATHDAS